MRRAKLNEDQVREILASKESNKTLAVRFDCTPTTISTVRNFKGTYARYASPADETGNGVPEATVRVGTKNDEDANGERDVRSSAQVFDQLF